MTRTKNTLFTLCLVLILAACQATPAPTEDAPAATNSVAATNAPTHTTQPTELSPAVDATAEPTALPASLFYETPVVLHQDNGRYINAGAVIFHDGQYHMLNNEFSSWPARTRTYYYTSPNGKDWNRQADEPVFESKQVDFTTKAALILTGYVAEDGTWVVYFHTFTTNSGPGYIGRATAADPLGPWAVDPEPVLSPGSTGEWDDLHVMRANVMPVEDGYILIYAGTTGSKSAIGYAKSSDGIVWEKYDDPTTTEAPYAESDPILLPEADWEVSWLGRPEVVQTGTGWVMLYEGGGNSKTGIATSADGLNWVRSPNNPVLTLDNSVNGDTFFQGELHYHDGTYRYYLEIGPGAQSTDIYLWEFDAIDKLMGGVTAPLPLPDFSDIQIVTLTSEFDFAAGGLAIDADGYLYHANFNGSTIMKIAPDGQSSVFVDRDIAGAAGNTFGPDGNLYQSNYVQNRVSQITPDGEISIYADGIIGSAGLIFDSHGNLFAASCNANRIIKVTPEKEKIEFLFKEGLSCPNGLTIDEHDNLYVANFGDGNIIKITPTGEASILATIRGGNNGHLAYHQELGVLFVASRGGSRIYAVQAQTGETVLIVGTGKRGVDDGPGLSATVSLPNGVAISPDGRLVYINQVTGTTGQSNAPSIVRVIVLEGPLPEVFQPE